MSRKVVPVSILDEKMLSHIEDKGKIKGSKSQYIRELIRKDMNSNGLPEEMKSLIKDFIRDNFKSLGKKSDDDMNKDFTEFEDEINKIFEQ